jgi:two-component system phosphate regulon sensor histidine kinase PhoR
MPIAGWIAIVLLSLTAISLGAGWLIERRRYRRSRAQMRQMRERDALITSSHSALSAHAALYQIAYNCLLLVDDTHTVIQMNKAAFDLFHPPAREGLSLMAVTRQHEIDAMVQEALARGESAERQISVYGKRYRVRCLRDQTPQGVVVALALEDIAELERLGRARRDMVANISHHLRTPIAAIRLLADTLLREKTLHAAPIRTMLEQIVAQTEVLQQLAQELLDLASIESGRVEMILTRTSPRRLAAAVIDQLRAQAERKHIEIENAIPAKLVALADADQIKRVLGNLIHNAIKFTPEQGQISLSARADGEWAVISVADTGPGIPLPERERIFERFYRGDRSRSSGGTGLGLAIAKHIVLAHGGSIGVEDSPDGHGARISFRLPASHEPRAAT